MIFYYSATGNTRCAAQFLAHKLDTRLVDILQPDGVSSVFDEGEDVGFMCPIYCWGIPPVVWRFLISIIENIPESCYVWAVATCGDETGTAMRSLDRFLKDKRGRGADALFSLIMPNTYVMLPGFDVDSASVEEKKLHEAPGCLAEIALKIKNRVTGIYDVHEGSFPALRSMIFPLFKRWGVSTKLWKVSEDCISCGKCAAICPARNIRMVEGKPRWRSECYSCCACFHVCPVHAVAYGSITRSKSQYLCPGLPK